MAKNITKISLDIDIETLDEFLGELEQKGVILTGTEIDILTLIMSTASKAGVRHIMMAKLLNKDDQLKWVK